MDDKHYCMSSYLALKYIESDNKDFGRNFKHNNYTPPLDGERIMVSSASEIDKAIQLQLSAYQGKKVGVFLSGGMDSAIVASYLPGTDAYTFRYIGIDYPDDELRRAELFANYYGLNLHYVDISWESMIRHLDPLMINKACPVYYIEPQLHQAALQAKADGVEIIMVGEGSDLVFGGLSWLLSKDWTVDEFERVYTSTFPKMVLRHGVSLRDVFDRYRLNNDKIDYLHFLEDIFCIEAYTAYENAFSVAGVPYFDPFERLKMASSLDIGRVRNGEAKYLIRELYALRYPTLPIPEKIRLPNPLDSYLKDWPGPCRHEFLPNLNMAAFRGKHKWQLFCLERFLNIMDSKPQYAE